LQLAHAARVNAYLERHSNNARVLEKAELDKKKGRVQKLPYAKVGREHKPFQRPFRLENIVVQRNQHSDSFLPGLQCLPGQGISQSQQALQRDLMADIFKQGSGSKLEFSAKVAFL